MNLVIHSIILKINLHSSLKALAKKKSIKKLIQFRLVNSSLSIYNLALVDILPDGDVSDLSISNNQDMPKVLATVFQAIDYRSYATIINTT